MASMRANSSICVVQYECHLIFLSGSEASSILACIVVERSFIKLNIIHSASGNQQKYITHIQDIRSLSLLFVISFFFSSFFLSSSERLLHIHSLKHRYLNILLSNTHTINRFILLTTI
jgi:hypothetical protein